MSDTEEFKKKSKTHIMVATALMTAVTCVLAPMSITIGPIPISFTNLVIYLSLYLLGWKMGTVSCVVYILIGMVGLPVFSGFSGGIAKLLGPTGGYIIGFIPMAVIAGLVIGKSGKRLFHFLAMVVGTAVCYTLGTVWYCTVTGTGAVAALSMCVFPFIPVDIAKMVIVMIVGPMLKKRLRNSGLLTI